MEQDYYIKNNISKFIEISGDDRTNFLQGLITNDINQCHQNNIGIYSCLLSPQGKFLADFFIVDFKDRYLIEIHEKFFESFYTKLKLYKLRSKVNFKENNNLLSLVIFLKDSLNFKEDTIFFTDPRSYNLGIKVYINKNSNDLELINKLKKCDFQVYEKNLIKNLIPNASKDLIENKSLLLENNFQNINAIDWDKGCYIGQEITARMKYRALLKKKIYVLELIDGDINPGEDILENGVMIGSAISKVGKYILCMLKINLTENIKLNKEKIIINSSTEIRFL